MSIASEITSMGENLKKDYQSIANLGADLTNVDKNIENIAELLDGVYDVLPKTSFQEGTSVTIEGGLKGKIDFDEGKVGFGDTEQSTTQGRQLFQGISYAVNTVGVDFTYTLDGGIKAVGLATADAFSMTTGNSSPYRFDLEAGTYIISGAGNNTRVQVINSSGTQLASDTGSGASFTLSATTSVYVRIMVLSGTNINHTFYPMLETGSTAHDWEQYTGGYASPSPNWEQPIQCVTGNQDVVVSSSNVLTNATWTENYFLNSDDEEVSNSGWKYSDYIDISNGNWQYQANQSGSSPKTILYDNNKNKLYALDISGATIYDLSNYNNVKYIRVSAGKTSSPKLYITPTSYQLSLGDIELCKIGDYADELLYDVDEDKVYKNEVITRKILTGANTEFWQVNAITGAYVFAYGVTNYKRTNELICMCNYFKAIVNGTYGSMTDGQCRFRYYNDELYNFYVCMDDITNVSDFKTWLSTHNLEVYYVLAIPTLTEITDTTLKQQVKNWYYSQSFTGTTIIESNGDLPMIIKVRALKGE